MMRPNESVRYDGEEVLLGRSGAELVESATQELYVDLLGRVATTSVRPPVISWILQPPHATSRAPSRYPQLLATTLKGGLYANG